MKFDPSDFRTINSMTKYPSIQTYHEIDRGILKENLTDDGVVPNHDEAIYATEKIDGTNTRIIITHGDYIIGSREELLCSLGDRLYNPSQGIVQAIRGIARDIYYRAEIPNGYVVIVYGETYGGNIGAGAKNYTSDKDTCGFRVFDIKAIDKDQFKYFQCLSPDQIAPLREHNEVGFWFNVARPGNAFAERMMAILKECSIETVPPVATFKYSELPTGRNEMYSLLCSAVTSTQAALDDTAKKTPEGMVLRTADRRWIRKVRFEDYQKTFKKLNKK